MERIGAERSEQLDYIPASLRVIEHVRFKYACKHCEQKVVTADKDRQPIEKGLPAAGLLAHVVISKYLDHQPLYRLEGILNRHDNVYDYTPNRSRAGPELFLRDYQQGYLQADAYAGYDFIFDDSDRKVIELLCWAHARRKFYDARSSSPQLSHTALAWNKMLYQIEKEIKNLSAEQKKAVRQEKAVVILNDFKNRLDEIPLEQALPQSPIRQAINYALNSWEALCRPGQRTCSRCVSSFVSRRSLEHGWALANIDTHTDRHIGGNKTAPYHDYFSHSTQRGNLQFARQTQEERTWSASQKRQTIALPG